MNRTRALSILAAAIAALFLSGCEGGDGGSGSSDGGSQQPAIASNSIQVSDILFSTGTQGFPDERGVTTCAPDSSSCTGSLRGQEITVTGNDLRGTKGDTYLSLDTWDHMRLGVVFRKLEEGLHAKVAMAGGIRHPNSLPVRGAATWRGEMVALDDDNALTRGDAALTIPDLAQPQADVTLTPSGRATMTWNGIPVTGGGFKREDGPDNYIRGEFYGSFAQEVGGVFERNRMIGAFGAKR